MKRILILIATISLSSGSFAQSCPEGSQALNNRQFKEAYSSFSKCLESSPKDSSIVFLTGYTALILEKYKEAIPLLSKSIDLNYQPSQFAQFALGLSYAAMGKEELALSSLEASAKGGFAAFARMDSAQFLSIKDKARLNSIRKDIYENAFPCLKDKNNNKFDFWLGEWDVYVGSQKRADSKITKANGGCAVHEDYVVLGGSYTGQSISFYEPNEQRWHQYWVGSAGDKSIYYEADEYEGNLQFITKSPISSGGETWTRMTYIAQYDGSVHQNLDNSTDEGKTWTPGFRGIYKRK